MIFKSNSDYVKDLNNRCEYVYLVNSIDAKTKWGCNGKLVKPV